MFAPKGPGGFSSVRGAWFPGWRQRTGRPPTPPHGTQTLLHEVSTGVHTGRRGAQTRAPGPPHPPLPAVPSPSSGLGPGHSGSGCLVWLREPPRLAGKLLPGDRQPQGPLEQTPCQPQPQPEAATLRSKSGLWSQRAQPAVAQAQARWAASPASLTPTCPIPQPQTGRWEAGPGSLLPDSGGPSSCPPKEDFTGVRARCPHSCLHSNGTAAGCWRGGALDVGASQLGVIASD